MINKITCDHCKKEYDSYTNYERDCFVSSDGWVWDIFHNYLKDKGIEIHGYKIQ
ncbi:hypothetical protein MACH08_19910 [Oceanobacillus kimchii]|uniref:Uncharacterized protein n=1 Tax=Oceanobacillus kimchii TaxID=746691 RepID=A0ABQ5TNS0_9BACI|nr:hypothetical protein MACH08_19910 [Oceanobacillus kimchii]